ncbi:MAG: hypothetical protein AAF674_08990 [Pseudomonadota bacterium]
MPFSIVALHEVDAALAGSDLTSRIRAAAIILFLPMVVLGTLAITYILRRWLLLRAGLSVQLARWYAARTDMWLSPMALAIPLAFQPIFAFPAVVSFLAGILFAEISERSLEDEWPPDFLQILMSVLIAVSAAGSVVWWFDGRVDSIAGLIACAFVATWLWLIALLGWRRPPSIEDEAEVF